MTGNRPQISFVGNLYDSQMMNIMGIMDDYHKGFLDAVMKAQSKIYGYYLVDNVLTDGLMEKINKVVYDKTVEYRNKNGNRQHVHLRGISSRHTCL